eukprot:3423896-Amphidinium_carterae.1
MWTLGYLGEFGEKERDQVRRFITLIDALYECHTKLVCTADLDPISLFHVTEEAPSHLAAKVQSRRPAAHTPLAAS